MPQDDYQAEMRLMQTLHDSPALFADISETTGTELHRQQELRKKYPPELVRAGLQLVELRHKAASKFMRAESMWFDRISLQQASSESIAGWKAKRFSGLVIDACAGIGGDSLSLAKTSTVLAVEQNPVRCQYINWNASAYDVSDRLNVLSSDITAHTPQAEALLHIDPDQRGGRPGRSLRLEHCTPDYKFLLQCQQRFRGGAIKLSPAANFGGKFTDAEIELISDHGECKQAVVWFGELRESTPWRATVLPAGETIAGDPLSAATCVTPLGKYLFDPDPAVVRSGLVDLLAEQHALTRLDDAEEYLTGNDTVDSAFLNGFEVRADLPYNEKTLRQYFRDSNVGQLEIKCRHVPVKIEALRRKLTLPGDEPATLIVAKSAGKTRALVCTRVRK